METTDTETTQLAEQSQNPSQAGQDSASISKDVGRNFSEETGSSGGGLDKRLDQANSASSKVSGASKAEENALKIGAEGDEAARAETAAQRRMVVVNTGIYHSEFHACSGYTRSMKFVNLSHDVRRECFCRIVGLPFLE